MTAGLIGAGVGALVNIGSQIFAGHKQKQIAKQQEDLLNQYAQGAAADRDRDMQYAQDLYNRDYYTNYTDTAQGRNMLGQMKDLYKNANATSMLAGGTLSEEAKLARLANQTDQVANATANMAAMDTQRKVGIQNQFNASRQDINNNYANTMNSVYNQRQGILGQKMDQWDNFAKSGAGLGSAIMGMDFGSLFGKNKTA